MGKMSNRIVCAHCDGEAVGVREERSVTVGRRSAIVEVDFARCNDCRGEFFLAGQLELAQRKASDAIRRAEGLQLAGEIRAIRQRLGLSQLQFERLLGVGPKTVVRWEGGTVFQNRATDSLLRLVDALPEAAIVLARWHGVELPAHSGEEKVFHAVWAAWKPVEAELTSSEALLRLATSPWRHSVKRRGTVDPSVLKLLGVQQNLFKPKNRIEGSSSLQEDRLALTA